MHHWAVSESGLLAGLPLARDVPAFRPLADNEVTAGLQELGMARIESGSDVIDFVVARRDVGARVHVSSPEKRCSERLRSECRSQRSLRVRGASAEQGYDRECKCRFHGGKRKKWFHGSVRVRIMRFVPSAPLARLRTGEESWADRAAAAVVLGIIEAIAARTHCLVSLAAVEATSA